jgi:hypothetical protein
MLTAVPYGFWAPEYVLSDETGRALARVKLHWGGEAGTITLDGAAQNIRRDGMMGPWHVWSSGTVVATVIKPSAFSRLFHISVGSAEYRMVPRAWSSAFDLFAGDQRLGGLERRGILSRTMAVFLPDDLPMMVRAIAVWVVLLMWRRADAAS